MTTMDLEDDSRENTSFCAAKVCVCVHARARTLGLTQGLTTELHPQGVFLLNFLFYLRQDLTKLPTLGLHLQSFCLILESAGITSVLLQSDSFFSFC